MKKVSSNMANKNPSRREGAAAPVQSNAFGEKVELDKPPVFTRDGRKWKIQYQKRNHDLVVENTEINNVVFLYKCMDCTVTIKGTVSSVVIDACKQTAIIIDSVAAGVEFVNCQFVQMQMFGKVPTIFIDKTDGCQLYVSPDSLCVEVLTSKSSQMNIMIPNSSGDFIKKPLPEQYMTTITPNKMLRTTSIENGRHF